jgi:hypothetical protein
MIASGLLNFRRYCALRLEGKNQVGRQVGNGSTTFLHSAPQGLIGHQTLVGNVRAVESTKSVNF